MVTRRSVTLVTVVLVLAVLGLQLGAGDAAAWPWDNLGEKATEVSKGLMSRLVNALLWALIALMKFVAKFFNSDKNNFDERGFSAMIEWATSYTWALQAAFLFVSLIYFAARLAMAQWLGGTGQVFVNNGLAVSARALVTSLGAATVVILATRASDLFAAWIYGDTGQTVDKLTKELQKSIGTIDSKNFDGSSLLLVVIAIIALLGCLDLLIQLFLRQFYLTAGAAALPVAAAASGTDTGKASYDEIVRLCIAMIAFKPIAATAFNIAMRYPLGDTTNSDQVFVAILLYIAPVLCLPTLLALVGVGGNTHGRVSGLAGMAVGYGGARALGRIASRGGGAARSAATGKSASLLGAQSRNRPTGARPVSSRGPGGRPGGPSGGPRPGGPRGPGGGPGSRGPSGGSGGSGSGRSGGPRSPSPSTSGGSSARASGTTAATGASPTSLRPPSDGSGGAPGSGGSPRPAVTPTAERRHAGPIPPPPNLGTNTAKATARRNLGANNIRK